jgi:hypothetical protein
MPTSPRTCRKEGVLDTDETLRLEGLFGGGIWSLSAPRVGNGQRMRSGESPEHIQAG